MDFPTFTPSILTPLPFSVKRTTVPEFAAALDKYRLIMLPNPVRLSKNDH